jgi:hypothetical protein
MVAENTFCGYCYECRISVRSSSSINCTNLDNSRFDIFVDVDLSDYRGSNICKVIVSGLTAEAGPAGCPLSINLDSGGLAGVSFEARGGQVKYVKTDARISDEERLGSRDRSERERKNTASRGCDPCGLLGERTVGFNVPNSHESGGRRNTLYGSHETLTVFTENNLTSGSSRTSRRRGLGYVQGTECVWFCNETERLIDSETTCSMSIRALIFNRDVRT